MPYEADVEHVARQELVFGTSWRLWRLVEGVGLLEHVVRSIVFVVPLDACHASGKAEMQELDRSKTRGGGRSDQLDATSSRVRRDCRRMDNKEEETEVLGR